MRIVFVAPFGLQPKGTVSARTIPIAQALVRRGHSVAVVVPPWDSPEDSGKSLDLDGVPVLNVRLPSRLPLIWYLLVTYRLLQRALSATGQHPEVVHFFKPKAFSGLAMMALWLTNKLRLTRIRLVVDSDDWEGKGGWNELGNYTWAQRAFFPFQEKWVLGHAHAVTVASRTLEEKAGAFLPSRLIHYLPNGVSPLRNTGEPAEIRRSYGLEGRPVILLYTRFLEFGLERIIFILHGVLSSLPQAALLVVGKGLFGEEERLAALVRREGLGDQVVFAGWVDRARLGDYFSAADIDIFPMDDTLINRAKCSAKLVELLCAGLPVVADAVGQNCEYIVHEETGLLVEPGNDGAFAQAVVRLLRDEGLRQRMGKAAGARMLRRYNWDYLTAELERIYRP